MLQYLSYPCMTLPHTSAYTESFTASCHLRAPKRHLIAAKSEEISLPPSLAYGLGNSSMKFIGSNTMKSNFNIAPEKKKSVHALEATNFFLADVQTGFGPFLAAYLAGSGWAAWARRGGTHRRWDHHGRSTGSGGRHRRSGQVKETDSRSCSAVLALGAVLLSMTAAPWAVYTSQFLIGGAGPFLGPTLAAVTMGIVGVTFFDRQFGKNQSFNSAGNVACALADRRHKPLVREPRHLHHRCGLDHPHGARHSSDQKQGHRL